MAEEATSRGPASVERRLAGLPPVATSAGAARRFVAETLLTAGQEGLFDEAVLAVSELVTNAVVHARTPVEVAVLVDPDGIRIEVSDGSRRVPQIRDSGSLAETGRGLRLLADGVTAWGAEVRPDGKTVWCRLATRPAPRGGEAVSQEPLGSPDHG